MRFAVSMMATNSRLRRHPINCCSVAVVEARDELEALGLACRMAHVKYPHESGWSGHVFGVQDVDAVDTLDSIREVVV